jgi:hypothetical protein
MAFNGSTMAWRLASLAGTMPELGILLFEANRWFGWESRIRWQVSTKPRPKILTASGFLIVAIVAPLVRRSSSKTRACLEFARVLE